MGIVASTLIGLVTGGAVWRYMRYKNGDTIFGTYDEYTNYPVPIVIQPDGSKSEAPWKGKSYDQVNKEIKTAIAKGKDFEGQSLRKFHTTLLSKADQELFGHIVHEAHLHTCRGKRCKVYLQGDRFVLKVS